MSSGSNSVLLSTEERSLMKIVKEDIGPLQRYRYRLTYDTIPAQYNLINTEQKLQEIAQREESLTKEMELTSCLEETKAIQKKLDGLQQDYFVLRQTWLRWRNEFTEYISRAFDLWRSYPYWYLHRVLRNDCALKGGCCGRDCGC
ncbi:hypothetical protein N7540_012900 [Penicillium herquei]|nr:hypothetical protein N7540_012900 [Penicillium herquei]